MFLRTAIVTMLTLVRQIDSKGRCGGFVGSLLWLVLVFVTGGPPSVSAEKPETAGPAGSSANSSPDDTDSAERDKKERAATVAVYLLVLVILVGVGLLALVVLWGHRVRRLTRKPTRSLSLGDELWYLRPKRNAVLGEQPSTPVPEGRMSDESDDEPPAKP